jgi:pimeloyl-ACP methyl ester carboxylesterase
VPLDVNEVVREVFALVRGELISHQVSVRTEFAPALPVILGDRVQLQQVIINLVMNGIEAMQSVTDRPRELHGWPYDIYSFVDVAPLLASAGYRVIVPYLRGYGSTRFLSDVTLRNGQPSAIAVDMIALMEAIGIEKATLAGFDWGARTANIMAALWPERCKGMVSVSGYLIGNQEAGKKPLPPKAELQWWYQFYFATERGREGYDKYRHDFSKLIWQLASPKWDFGEATFDRSATAFDNPDHVAIVIHNYRWRLGLVEGEAKYEDLEKRLAKRQRELVRLCPLCERFSVQTRPKKYLSNVR